MSRSMLKWVRGMVRRQAPPYRGLARFTHRTRVMRPLAVELLENRCLLSGGITEFPVPDANGQPFGIAAGPDGNIWFTEWQGPGNIVRMTPSGQVSGEFPVTAAPPSLTGITAGPDGKMWFCERNYGNSIGNITTDGQTLHEYPLQNLDDQPHFITVGPSATDLWVALYGSNQVARITLAGAITRYDVPIHNGSSLPTGITAGADGNVWFTELQGNRVGRITANGTITEFTLPTVDSFPIGITSGSDGNLWFTERSTNSIGRITPFGSDEVIQQSIREFPIPTANSIPYGITSGPDGNIWFAESGGNKIGQITLAGVIQEFAIPTANSLTYNVTSGPDGNIWFAEQDGNNIGKLDLHGSGVTTGQTLPASLWLNLANTDDIGTHFDVRVEALDQSGQVFASGMLDRFQPVRVASAAQAVTLTASRTVSFNAGDSFSFRVSTRIDEGPGHFSGRLQTQFDAVSRSSSLGVNFGTGNQTYYLHENPHENDGTMNRTDNTGDTSVNLITKLASKAGGDPWVVMGTWTGAVSSGNIPPPPGGPGNGGPGRLAFEQIIAVLQPVHAISPTTASPAERLSRRDTLVAEAAFPDAGAVSKIASDSTPYLPAHEKAASSESVLNSVLHRPAAAGRQESLGRFSADVVDLLAVNLLS
jgi:streptogramin lyase